MSEKLKSAIRHILVVLLSIMGFVGLKNYIPLIQLIQDNLDGIIGNLTGIISFIGAVIAFFSPNKNLESRFTVQENALNCTNKKK